MPVRCVGHQAWWDGHFISTVAALKPTKDGDNAFTTFDYKNHYLMGRTGKYKGITGTIPYTVVELHDTVGGHPANIVNHKGAKNSGWQNRAYFSTREGLVCRIRACCVKIDADAFTELRGLPHQSVR
jgi:hypothetical protein